MVVLIIILVISFFACATAYHHIMLRAETAKLIPNGRLINVNGHNLHVYCEGKPNDDPTLVFMSGSATVAPVYDFKQLYTKLSGKYRIAVIEKSGYGYSEISGSPRNISTMLFETRQALKIAGEKPPYIFVAHSISGIEALYWVQQYPDEISGIIGLDMATPEFYENLNRTLLVSLLALGKVLVGMGIHRIFAAVYPLDITLLTDDEIKQQRMLMFRNALNKDYISESNHIKSNALLIADENIPEKAILLFTSNGKQISTNWVSLQRKFALAFGAEHVCFDCGHYLHYFESDTISEKIIEFIDKIK